MLMYRRAIIAIGVAATAVTPAVAGDRPFFMGLGDLAGADHFSWGRGVTPDGRYVVG